MRLSTDIVNVFLNYPCAPPSSPCSKLILENILTLKKEEVQEKGRSAQDVNMFESKITLVPNDKKVINCALNRQSIRLQRIKQDPPHFPHGVNITLNAIVTSPQSGGQGEGEGEGEECREEVVYLQCQQSANPDTDTIHSQEFLKSVLSLQQRERKRERDEAREVEDGDDRSKRIKQEGSAGGAERRRGGGKKRKGKTRKGKRTKKTLNRKTKKSIMKKRQKTKTKKIKKTKKTKKR